MSAELKKTSNEERSIFIIDDDDNVRISLEFLLKAYGFTVYSRPSAEEFLKVDLQKFHGCLLIDIKLPGLSGLELQKRVRATNPGLPIIILTGHADVGLAIQAMKEGAIDFLEKPYSDEKLLLAIAEASNILAQKTGPASLSAPEMERIKKLTPRERETLSHLFGGLSNKQIAYEIGVSPRTVELHRSNIMNKLECRSIAAVVRLVIASGVFM